MATVPISVILPHFNRSHLIGEAIDSILSQTLPPLEIIIVDDASYPPHREALDQYRSVARVIYLERNIGPGLARNAGVEAAKGDLIAFLDDDDQWFPDKLEHQWDVIRRDQSLDAVAGSMTIRYENGREGLLRSHSPEIMTLQTALEGTPAMLQSALVRTHVVRQLGGFDSSFCVMSDHEFWIRFTAAGYKARYLPEPVGRLDRRNIDRFTRDQNRYLACRLRLIDKHAELYDRVRGKGGARRERSRIIRRHGSTRGGVFGRLRYAEGCLLAAEWKPLVHLFTTGDMMEVPYARI